MEKSRASDGQASERGNQVPARGLCSPGPELWLSCQIYIVQAAPHYNGLAYAFST